MFGAKRSQNARHRYGCVSNAFLVMPMIALCYAAMIFFLIHNQSTGVFTREQLEAIIQSTARATPDVS